MKIILPVSIMLALLSGAFEAKAQVKMPNLTRLPSPQAVVDEHLDALNKCDWERLIAQFPDEARIDLPNGAVVKGRPAIAALFSNFCKNHKDGGLKGLNFKVENSTTIVNTLVTQWIATAPFLEEPYRGSDAYITNDGYMQAMVSTFNGEDLKMKK